MANGDNPELGIEITGKSDQAAAAINQTTASVAGLRGEASAAGQAAEQLGGHGSSAFGKLVQGGRAAHGAMMGVNTAMQGGASTAIGLSRALNDVFILVSASASAAGPWALLALGIGAVLGVMRGLIGHSKSAASALKETERAAEDTAKANIKLGEAWGTLEVKAFTQSLKEANIVIDSTIERMKVLTRTKIDLDKELSKQASIKSDIATEQTNQETKAAIDAINASEISPEEKKIRIARLEAKNEAAKRSGLQNKAAISKGASEQEARDQVAGFSMQEMEEQLKLDQENGVVRRNKTTISEREEELKRLTAQLGLLNQAKQEQANIDRERHQVFTEEGQSESSERAEQIARHNLAVLNQKTQGFPSADQLQSKIEQLLGEINTLVKETPSLEKAASELQLKTSGNYDVLEAEKDRVRKTSAASAVTSGLEEQLKESALNPGVVEQLTSVARTIKSDQTRMYGLTGDAFNAIQAETNRQVDLLQELLRIYKINDSQWKKIQRQIANASSYTGVGN